MKVRCAVPVWISTDPNPSLNGRYALDQVIEGEAAETLLADYPRYFERMKEE